MNSSIFNILIVLFYLSILANLTVAAELGPSSCRYLAGYDSKNKRCHEDVVKLKYLPNDCSALVFDGVTNELNSDTLKPTNDPKDLDHLKSLIEHTPNVFLFYQRGNQAEMKSAIYGYDHSIEVEEVKNFLNIYGVAGLILRGIEDPELDDTDFYSQFAAYVADIKTTKPDLKMGLYLSARAFVLNHKNSSWFDFSKLNVIVDFYVMEFASLNACTDELLRVGVTPFESPNLDIMTLSIFGAAYETSTINKEIVYFEFLISPKPKDNVINTFPKCEISYNEYCENDYAKTWCVDSQDTLYEKGQFAAKYAKGFVANDIDLVDRDLKCDCNGDKFITFNMLLNGYKGAEKLTCDRLNGK